MYVQLFFYWNWNNKRNSEDIMHGIVSLNIDFLYPYVFLYERIKLFLVCKLYAINYKKYFPMIKILKLKSNLRNVHVMSMSENFQCVMHDIL